MDMSSGQAKLAMCVGMTQRSCLKIPGSTCCFLQPCPRTKNSSKLFSPKSASHCVFVCDVCVRVCVCVYEDARVCDETLNIEFSSLPPRCVTCRLYSANVVFYWQTESLISWWWGGGEADSQLYIYLSHPPSLPPLHPFHLHCTRVAT